MPEREKHHYIPVFYLKQWTGPDGRLCQFSRPYDVVKPKRVHPDATGYVRGLYAIEDLDPEVTNVIETKLLKPADGLAALALHDLVNGRPFTRPGPMRTSWSRFVLSLLIRYPEAIAQMKRQLRENVEKMYFLTKRAADPDSFAEYEATHGTKELSRLHGKLVLDLIQDSRMGRLIFSMHWAVIGFRQHQHALLTSDRPLSSNPFRICANHLCLPISSNYVFAASETEAGLEELRSIEPDYIMQGMNDLTARRAQAYVYATDDSQLRFVENRLGKSTKPMGAYLV